MISTRSITSAHHWLNAAHRISSAIEMCGDSVPYIDAQKIVFRSYLEQAVNALGYELVERGCSLRVAVDNTEPNTMRG